MEWRPIESAPKNITRRVKLISGNSYHEYGPYILAYPVFGNVARVRWWQWSDDELAHNFLEDGGNSIHPTHWMPLPEPPQTDY